MNTKGIDALIIAKWRYNGYGGTSKPAFICTILLKYGFKYYQSPLYTTQYDTTI